MFAPIRPRPTMPTCMRSSDLFRVAVDPGSFEGEHEVLAPGAEAIEIERDVEEARLVHRVDDLLAMGDHVCESLGFHLDPSELSPLVAHPNVALEPEEPEGLLRLLDPPQGR